ncbi:MAG: CBS domain-containing protein, partial [Nitrososphaerota archaeon]
LARAVNIMIDSERTIREAAIMMDRMNVGCLLVTRDNKIIGIVTERDLVRRVLATGIDHTTIKVSEIMSYPVIAIEPDSSLIDAVKLMASYGFRRLPVIEKGGKLIGIVTINELAEALAATRDVCKELLQMMLKATKPPESMYQ